MTPEMRSDPTRRNYRNLKGRTVKEEEKDSEGHICLLASGLLIYTWSSEVTVHFSPHLMFVDTKLLRDMNSSK